MKIPTSLPLFALGMLAAAAGATAATTRHDHGAPIASATIKAADGTARGQAWIVASGGHGQLKLEVSGLPAGIHGVHLHAVGKCDGPDFTTAGGHLNPLGRMHGKDNPQGQHMGDLPNVTVAADGKGTLTVPLAGSEGELAASLFDADGTAVVVHAAADDYKTDPSGNSGGRIACGVLAKG